MIGLGAVVLGAGADFAVTTLDMAKPTVMGSIVGVTAALLVLSAVLLQTGKALCCADPKRPGSNARSLHPWCA